MSKVHVKFITEICSMYVAITPSVDGFLAIPHNPHDPAVPVHGVSGKVPEYMETRNTIDQISEAVEKADPDIRCENAMYHTLAFVFLVTLRENETPAQARNRTLQVFTAAWGNIVTEVKKGRSLTE